MAYDRYATELTDKENRIYGVMDSEAREELSGVKSAVNSNISYTWNQLSKLAQNWTMNFGSGTVTKGSDEISIANPPANYYAYTGIDTTPTAGHKYLFMCYAKATSATAGIFCSIGTTAVQDTTTSSDYVLLSVFATASNSATSFNYSVQLRCLASDSGIIYFKHPKMFDLTMMGFENITVDEFIAKFPDWETAELNTTGTLVTVTKLELMQDEIDTLDDRVDRVENILIIENNRDLYSSVEMTNDKYIVYNDGTLADSNVAKTSDYVAVSPGDVLDYKLTAAGQVSVWIACYDSEKTYLKNKSVQCTGTSGVWTTDEDEFTVPDGVAYIRFSTNKNYSTDTITHQYNTTLKETVTDLKDEFDWSNKKWAAFGDSITDSGYTDTHFLQPTGKYVPYLCEMSGLIVTDYGWAGASLMTNILERVTETDISDFDLVTVQGGYNDHATSKPLGAVGDKTSDTFAGAIYLIAKYVYENSNATLAFITPHMGRYVAMTAPDGTQFYGDGRPEKTNNDNLKQIDYINMMVNQCRYFGIPCIEAGQKSGISELTGDLYMMDHYHHSYVGGKQYAGTIWSELKTMHKRTVSVS